MRDAERRVQRLRAQASSEDEQRALLEEVGTDTFDPAACILEQIHTGIEFYRRKDPADVARIEAKSLDDIEDEQADLGHR